LSYNVLIVSADRAFPLEECRVFRREASGSSDRQYFPFAYVRNSQNSSKSRIKFFFIRLDTKREDFDRLLLNAFVDLKPKLTFFVGYGDAVNRAQHYCLQLCTKIWTADALGRAKSVSDVTVKPNHFPPNLLQKITGLKESAHWREVYSQGFGHNESPLATSSEFMVFCEITKRFLRTLLDKYVDVNCVEEDDGSFKVLRMYIERSAFFLRAPYPREPELGRTPIEIGRMRATAEDLVYSFVVAAAQEDFELETTFAENSTSLTAHGYQLASIKFEYNTPRHFFRKSSLQKAGREITANLSACLVDYKGLAAFKPGSVQMSAQMSNRDRALLSTYCQTDLIDHLIVGKVHVAEYDISYDPSRLPISFSTFVDRLVSVARASSRQALLELHHDYAGDVLLGGVVLSLRNLVDFKNDADFETCG
jgi:hypothetical protein